MKAALIIATALMLSACASTETRPPPPPKNTSFQVGKTHYSEVIKLLGEPNDSTRYADGSRAIHYFRTQSQTRTECQVPPYGKFPGGSEVESSLLSMTFNKNGILIRYSAVSGKTLTG